MIALTTAQCQEQKKIIIDDALKQDPTIADEFNLNQAQLLFVEPFCAIAEYNHKKLVMIINDVDEFVGKFAYANQEALYIVTSTLCDVMSQLPPNVKVLILSRWERGIAAVLDRPPDNIKQLLLPTDHS